MPWESVPVLVRLVDLTSLSVFRSKTYSQPAVAVPELTYILSPTTAPPQPAGAISSLVKVLSTFMGVAAVSTIARPPPRSVTYAFERVAGEHAPGRSARCRAGRGPRSSSGRSRRRAPR